MQADCFPTVIILAGGLGTRLRSRISDRPKSLAVAGDSPFLSYILTWIERQGGSKVILAVHHLADQIEHYVKYKYSGSLELICVRDPSFPLGTGGAIKHAYLQVQDKSDVLVMNGDTFCYFDILPVLSTHQRLGTGATVVVAEVSNSDRYGCIDICQSRVVSFNEKKNTKNGFVNCGVYVFSSKIISVMPEGAFSIERDFFPRIAKSGQLAAHEQAGIRSFIDIGTPESYEEFCANLVNLYK